MCYALAFVLGVCVACGVLAWLADRGLDGAPYRREVAARVPWY